MVKRSDAYLNILGNSLKGFIGGTTPEDAARMQEDAVKLDAFKQENARKNLTTLASLNSEYDTTPPWFVGPAQRGSFQVPPDQASLIGLTPGTTYTPIQHSVLSREADSKTPGGYKNTVIPLAPGQTFHEVPNDPFAGIGVKTDQYNQKQLGLLGDALDPNKQKQGTFGVSKQVFDRAERLETLANAFKNNNLDSRQIEELAIGLNAMLSGSNTGAQQQVSALVPKSVIGNVQKLKEFLVNEPQGTNQQAFVQRMLGSIGREKQTAADQIKRTQFQRISKFPHVALSMPNEFDSTLRSYGVDPDEYRQWVQGGYKPMSAVQSSDLLGNGNSTRTMPIQGMVRIRDSQGVMHDIPEINLQAARQRDPGLQLQ